MPLTIYANKMQYKNETNKKLNYHFKMKQKKYTFTEAYNRIPYNEMKGFRSKAKKVLGVTSDNQFCNYKLGKSNLRLNQYAGLVALFADYGIKDPIKETKTTRK